MKNKSIIIIVISIILIGAVLFLLLKPSGLKKDDGDDNKPTYDVVSSIELGKEQYIEQLKEVPIKETNDYFMITEKRQWTVPEHSKGTTVSFIIQIPYKIHVDGIDYNGIYNLNSHNPYGNDGNPKYTVSIKNLTSNYDISVLINKK